MALESESEYEDSGRDWSKFMWLGIAVVVAIMLAVLFKPEREVPVAQTRAHAWHILIEFEGADPEKSRVALELATQVRQRISDGESFEALAREFSEDEFSGGRGGDLGWMARGSLTATIDEYVWTAPLNQISEVLQSSYGFHIVRVTAREIAEAELYERALHERVLRDTAAGNEP